MRTETDRDSTFQLKTATAVADPVLVRVSTKQQHMLMLAQDATYDRAGAMALQGVQWVRVRRGLFSRKASLGHGTLERVSVLLARGSVWVALPGQASVRAAARRRSYQMVNLSRVQYEAYVTASPRRLLVALKVPMGLPRLSVGVMLAFYRVRAVVRNFGLPKLCGEVA